MAMIEEYSVLFEITDAKGTNKHNRCFAPKKGYTLKDAVTKDVQRHKHSYGVTGAFTINILYSQLVGYVNSK